ncbi:MAG: Calx-beta domain-containing protein [Candidatus Thiodiazotropha sp.]
MQYRNHLLGLLTIFGLIYSLESHAVVSVYCCDATAEAQFIQDLSNLPSISTDLTKESFEGSDWEGTRSSGVQSVTSQGITWSGSSTESSFVRTSTSGGDVHEGSYLMFPVDNRNTHLVPDKYTLSASGTTLYGVGGWFRSSTGAKIGFTANGSAAVDFTGSDATVSEWTFLGFIDDAGFTTVQVAAVDEGGDEVNIFFSDDFTLGAQSGAFPGQKLQFSSASYSVGESASTLLLTVERTGGTSGALSVDYSSDSETGTASAGQDYTAVSGTLNFADGESSQHITIDILDDNVFEESENFTVNLSGLNIGAQNSATITITDNDAAAVGQVQFSSSSYSFSEADGSVTITVQRDGGSSGSGSVNYAMSDVTAIDGSDYTAASGSLSFIDGQISSSVTLDITDDATAEGTETLLITLSNPQSVSLGVRDVAEVSITDDEPIANAGRLQFSGSSYNASESDATIQVPVTRSNGSSGAVSIVCRTSNLTATAGSDYTATQTTVNFADGELTSNCTIPLLDDSSYETDETFMITLASPGGGAVLSTPASAVVTLSSDDPVPASGSLQFSLSEYQINEDGGTATISVSRSGGSSGAIGVSYASSDLTAVAGEDYTAASGSLSFAIPGHTA